jgi:cytochrome c-type biogenesis protein CcsB
MPMNIQVYLANFSFCTLFISMIFYWIETSQFGKSLSRPISRIQANLTIQDGTSTPLAQKSTNLVLNSSSLFMGRAHKTVLWSGFWAPPRKPIRDLDFSNNSFFKDSNFGIIFMLISNFSIFTILILRWNESGHFPLSNLYESLMFLSWSLTFLHICIELGTFNAVYNLLKPDRKNTPALTSAEGLQRGEVNLAKNSTKKKTFLTKLIGSITSPCALFTNAFASFSLPPEMQQSSPLVPALQSNWLMMHVTVMILSYAALILGSLLSIGFLIITAPPLGGRPEKETNLVNNSSFSLINSNSSKKLPQPSKAGFKNPFKKGNDTWERSLTLSIALDNLSYRILGIGFPLLTIGILSGAVWANEAWGSYWSWDPKETWALLTWLVFAIYLHTRLTKGWEGKKPALIASLGFITVWVCYLGVNLIGEGLHSYGWL